jgi:uncharacterized membrane protein YfcA
MDISTDVIALGAITFFAAFVNGALGYGFSSLTVPLALLFLTNRVLNPALVLVEVFINAYVLFVDRASVRGIWSRAWPILIGVGPGIALGAYILASLNPGWMKLATYVLLLPLLLLQAAGWRRPVRSETLIGAPFGTGLGMLYSITTISGPPLALLFNNQGLVKSDFRAALALIRVAESSLTALAYYHLGLFTQQSLGLASTIMPSVLIGIPLGGYLIRRLPATAFRRLCVSFDIWIVGFGLARALGDLKIAGAAYAYAPMVAAILLDAWFSSRQLRKVSVP